MNKRVFVVDDEDEFASTLAERLRLRGYETETFTRAEKALEAARRKPPDIVLLDVKLLLLSGMELLMTIRQYVPGVRVVLLTGHVNHETRIEGVRLDYFPCLMKPLVMEELLATIGEGPPNHSG